MGHGGGLRGKAGDPHGPAHHHLNSRAHTSVPACISSGSARCCPRPGSPGPRPTETPHTVDPNWPKESWAPPIPGSCRRGWPRPPRSGPPPPVPDLIGSREGVDVHADLHAQVTRACELCGVQRSLGPQKTMPAQKWCSASNSRARAIRAASEGAASSLSRVTHRGRAWVWVLGARILPGTSGPGGASSSGTPGRGPARPSDFCRAKLWPSSGFPWNGALLQVGSPSLSSPGFHKPPAHSPPHPGQG